MAKCPKCEKKLRIVDWRPECPHCGVNVFYYGFEERFYADAKRSEMDAAKIRMKWARVKAAFIGGKLPIARLLLTLLPLAALLVPFGSLTVSLPLFEKTVPFSGIGLVTAFTDGTFGWLSSLGQSAAAGEQATAAVRALIGVGSAALFAVLLVLFELLCFIHIKRMAAVMAAASVFGFAGAVFTATAAGAFTNQTAGGLLTGSRGPGVFFAAAAFGLIFILNLIVARKGIRVSYKEGDDYRVETARKFKRGETTLEEIPLPVYSAENARQARGGAENG